MAYGDRNRPREITPATPFLCLQDRTGEIYWSTTCRLVWRTKHISTSDFSYTTGSTQITVNTPGFYEIIYELAAKIKSGALNYTYFKIKLNGHSLNCSRSYIHLTGGNAASTSGHGYTFLNKGDIVELWCYVSSGGGTVETIRHSSRFIIKGMANKGWNNSNGGVTSYRGGVMR